MMHEKKICFQSEFKLGSDRFGVVVLIEYLQALVVFLSIERNCCNIGYNHEISNSSSYYYRINH